MASATSPSVERLVQHIKTDGFLYLKDAAKGVQAEEFGRKQFPITTNEGIDFCKAHTFHDPVRRCYPHSTSSNIPSSEFPGSWSLFLTVPAWECSPSFILSRAARTTSSSISRNCKVLWSRYGAVGHRRSTTRSRIIYLYDRPEHTTACLRFLMSS
jgi:hypothetical protein